MAAAVSAAGLALVVLAACSNNPTPGPPTTIETPTGTTPSPLAWTPLDPAGSDDKAIPPGRYGLTANGAGGMPWAVVEVGDGYSSMGFLLHDLQTGTGGMAYWTVAGVYRDPCDTTAGLIDAGTTVDDLAEALGQQKLSALTDPIPVTLDGYVGLYLELKSPDDIDLDTCGYDIWDSSPGGGRYMQEAGQVDRIWILDVDGDRLVFHATVWGGVPQATLDRLTDIVTSVDFVPRS